MGRGWGRHIFGDGGGEDTGPTPGPLVHLGSEPEFL